MSSHTALRFKSGDVVSMNPGPGWLTWKRPSMYNRTPRFKVGDVVYKEAHVTCGEYIWSLADFRDGNHNNEIRGFNVVELTDSYHERSDIMECIDKRVDEYREIIFEPAAFGVIIDEPPVGTYINTGYGDMDRGMWEGNCFHWENDIPGSPAIWCHGKGERKYFVKWMNKEGFTIYGKEDKWYKRLDECLDIHWWRDLYKGWDTETVSLSYESHLRKAPNFVEILRKRVKQRNAELVLVLQERIGLDTVTTNGIATKISNYC